MGIKGWKERRRRYNEIIRGESNEGPAVGTVRKCWEGAGNHAHIPR